jgi:hypothetical protein
MTNEDKASKIIGILYEVQANAVRMERDRKKLAKQNIIMLTSFHETEAYKKIMDILEEVNCEHDKVYDMSHVAVSLAHEWICRKCRTKGYDPFEKMDNAEYEKVLHGEGEKS